VKTLSNKKIMPPPPRTTRPHRCNDRVEDAVQALVGGGGAGVAGVRRALANVVACLRSDPGGEPTTGDRPYVVLTGRREEYVTPRVVGGE
jgi:hypothetical protein